MRSLETFLNGNPMRDPAHGAERKQPQAHQPADVIADYGYSEFMKVGSRIDIVASGRRRAGRAESVDLEPDRLGRNPSQRVDQSTSLCCISEDAVGNCKRVDQRDPLPSIPIKTGSEPFACLDIASQPRVARILQQMGWRQDLGKPMLDCKVT